MAVQLKVKKRSNETKSEAKSIRRSGGIPAVLYGRGVENQPVSVDSVDFIKVIREVGQNGVFNLDLDGTSHSVMVHELQKDVLKDDIVHVDFYQVDMKAELDANVPIHLVGEPAGQRDGGVIQQTAREIMVRALPSDIPSQIDVNIGHLNIGDSILVSDLEVANKYEIKDDENEVIVSILPPNNVAAEDDADADGEGGEPELIGEEKADSE